MWDRVRQSSWRSGWPHAQNHHQHADACPSHNESCGSRLLGVPPRAQTEISRVSLLLFCFCNKAALASRAAVRRTGQPRCSPYSELCLESAAVIPAPRLTKCCVMRADKCCIWASVLWAEPEPSPPFSRDERGTTCWPAEGDSGATSLLALLWICSSHRCIAQGARRRCSAFKLWYHGQPCRSSGVDVAAVARPRSLIPCEVVSFQADQCQTHLSLSLVI